jgi:hypothetical protein
MGLSNNRNRAHTRASFAMHEAGATDKDVSFPVPGDGRPCVPAFAGKNGN